MVKINKSFFEKVEPTGATRATYPIIDWYDELVKDGAVSIPIYTSKKKDENPDGLKFNAVRDVLNNPGLQILDFNKRQDAKNLFQSSFYTHFTDDKGHRNMLIVTEDKMKEFEDYEFTFYKVTEPMRKSPVRRPKEEGYQEEESDDLLIPEDLISE